MRKYPYRLFRLAMTMAATMLVSGSTILFAADGNVVPRSALPGVQPLDSVELREMPWVDVEKLLAEDVERESQRVPVAPRIAKNLQVDYTPDNSGTWETLGEGSRLWRLRISSPGATSLNLGLTRFELPEGAAFWVHAADGSRVQGPYTSENVNSVGGLWTAVVLGDEVVAELLVPRGAEADLEIAAISHGYRHFFAPTAKANVERGSCNINVICPQGDPWRDAIRSVALLTASDGIDTFGCTAQLVNNTAEDLTPYMLTAEHCMEEASWAPTVVAYWNFQTSDCDDIGSGNFTLSQNQSGSTLVTSWATSDFALIELDQEPRGSFNVYYSGWDARDRIPDSTTTIHHPMADEKSISFDDDPPTITSYLDYSSPGNGRFFRIGEWDEGTTESGSSGSCLFDDATGRCIGTLSGGYASCFSNDSDWYGRMSVHWTGGGSQTSRLSDWLDPLAGGTLFVDGKNGMGVGTVETWLIPAAASLAGVPPTNWKSQIGLVNPTSETRTASVYFVASGAAWPGTLLSGPHTIAANQSLYLNDPLLPANPTAGLLYVSVDGTGTAVFCRTFTPAPGGGTYGQGQPGILLSSAASETELILPLIHSAPDVFRTNVGFAQASAGTFQVRVQIYAADGTLVAQKTYSQAAAWRQVSDIFRNMGVGSAEIEGGWIKVTLISGSPSYWTTYATVIDDVTDDPTYILPVAP